MLGDGRFYDVSIVLTMLAITSINQMIELSHTCNNPVNCKVILFAELPCSLYRVRDLPPRLERQYSTAHKPRPQQRDRLVFVV